jgi:hypothetical protein
MKRTKVIVELEWDKPFDINKFRTVIDETLEKDPNLTAYSIYENA